MLPCHYVMYAHIMRLYEFHGILHYALYYHDRDKAGSGGGQRFLGPFPLLITRHAH